MGWADARPPGWRGRCVAVCVLLVALTVLLDYATDDVSLPPDARLDLGFTVLPGLLSLTYLLVGALIASRLPTNPIGWIFCGMGLIHAVQRFAVAYADYAIVENFAVPGGDYVAWFSSWVGSANLTLGVLLVLLFPDGRLLSRRWRIVAWAALCGAGLAALGIAFTPGQLSSLTITSRTRSDWWGSSAAGSQHTTSLGARSSSVWRCYC